MAIHTQQVEEVQGFDKEIEASALNTILDNLQKSQYIHPQKSTIRELVSNGLDSIRERDVALGILDGTLQEADYFLHRDDPMYKDSNFDKTYYVPRHLWNVKGHYQGLPEYKEVWGRIPSNVYVTYHDGGEREKDKIIIEDYGVGLGGRRLEKYFNLGYSTKRNSKFALGKFGIGAKAALSTAPYFTMTSRHNGREYAFNVYPHSISSIIPKFDIGSGKINNLHLFSNGAQIWYRETFLPNGVKVEVECKKHHKQLYIDAVKSQLLYFDNVIFQVRNAGGGLDTIDIKAKVLYEDEYILLSDNNQYSKPHLLINKINYGYVDFQELELADLQGNIGIKVEAENITVNPSRESVVWDELTRATIVDSFTKVVGIAERMISSQLKVDDFIQWITACSQVSSRWVDADNILGRLSKIVDLSNAKIGYSKDPTIEYGYKLFMGLNIRVHELKIEREGSIVKYIIRRNPLTIAELAKGLPLYIMHEGASFQKDKYLLQDVYPDGFIGFRVPFEKDEEGVEDNEGIKLTAQMNAALQHDKKLTEKELIAYMTKVSGYLQGSMEALQYSEVVVPESFDTSEEVDQKVAKTAEAKEARAVREKLQREHGVIPIFTPRNVSSAYVDNGAEKWNKKLYDWQKIELPVAEVDSWDEDEVFYATDKAISKDEDGGDILESELLHLAAAITRPNDSLVCVQRETTTRPDGTSYEGIREMDTSVLGTHKVQGYSAAQCHNFYFQPKVKLIKVAQDRRKFFMDFKPIQRFFMDIKNKTLTMSSALVRWNTARIIEKDLDKLKFLNNFSRFHGKYASAYESLVKYVNTNYRNLEDHSTNDRYYGLRSKGYDELIAHVDKLTQFQLLVRDNADNVDLIAQAAKEMFNPKQEITDGCAVDLWAYDLLQELLDYAAPVYILLNEVGRLTGQPAGVSKFINEELEAEIRAYLTYRNTEMQ